MPGWGAALHIALVQLMFEPLGQVWSLQTSWDPKNPSVSLRQARVMYLQKSQPPLGQAVSSARNPSSWGEEIGKGILGESLFAGRARS